MLNVPPSIPGNQVECDANPGAEPQQPVNVEQPAQAGQAVQAELLMGPQRPAVPVSIRYSISQQQIDDFRPYYERYYTEKYCTNFTTPEVNLDTCFRVHSNKVSVVFISKNHSIVKKKQRIQHLEFQVSPKVNRLNNKMRGKAKRGAQLLQPNSVLCYIDTEDGDRYAVHAGIHGKLLEINARIVDNPNLIIDDLCEGFVAIILPDRRRHEDNMKSLLSAEEYNNSFDKLEDNPLA